LRRQSEPKIGEARKERLMTVVCAWCESQGRTTVLGEKEPLDRPMISHGICEEHARAFLAELREVRTPRISLDRRGL
jgi:hypothetical protein